MKDLLKKIKDYKTKKFAAKRLILASLDERYGNKKIRPAYYSGSGRYTTLIDRTDEITEILNALQIPYTLDNDAVRFGKHGNYITINI